MPEQEVSRRKRHSPIVLAGLVLLLVRSASLVISQLLEGQVEARPLLLSLLYGAGEAMLLSAGLLSVGALLRPLRVLMNLIACIGFPLLIFVGLIDLFLFTITGDHLTPSVMKQFAGLRLFTSSNFIEPVRAHALPIGFALAIVFACFGAFLRLFWTRGYGAARVDASWPEVLRWSGLGAVLFCVALLLGSYSEIQPPVEVLYAQDFLGADGVRLDRSEEESIAALRAFLGLAPGERWLDDRYPLVHGPDPSASGPRLPAPEDPPDVVVIVIESLRGRCLRFVDPAGDGCVAPNLEALAREGVVFAHYLSNGFPSGPGFITMSASIWPHHRKRIVSSLKDVEFDGLAPRLGSMGYSTIAVDIDASLDKQSYWLDEFFDITVIEDDVEGFRSDRKLFGLAAEKVREHDARSPGKPFYIQIKTMAPHLPYDVPDDENETRSFGPSLPENYRASIAYVDRQLGEFVRMLEARERAGNTLIVVTGDHANYLDQEKTTALPLNDSVWTAAIFHGSEALIGPPRRIDTPASHVDINPTIMARVGDHRPTASLGRDLFGPSRRSEPSAVAVRPGGLRIDRRGDRLIVDREHPTTPIVGPAFPEGSAPAAVPEGAFASDEAPRLLQNVLTLSWLMEHDRIWSDAFLSEPASGAPASTPATGR